MVPSSPEHTSVEERAVGDPPAVARRAHELLVHVVAREVAGDPGEEIDVRFSDSLVDLGPLAYGERGARFFGGCHRRLLERRHDSATRSTDRVAGPGLRTTAGAGALRSTWAGGTAPSNTPAARL